MELSLIIGLLSARFLDLQVSNQLHAVATFFSSQMKRLTYCSNSWLSEKFLCPLLPLQLNRSSALERFVSSSCWTTKLLQWHKTSRLCPQSFPLITLSVSMSLSRVTIKLLCHPSSKSTTLDSKSTCQIQTATLTWSRIHQSLQFQAEQATAWQSSQWLFSCTLTSSRARSSLQSESKSTLDPSFTLVPSSITSHSTPWPCPSVRLAPSESAPISLSRSLEKKHWLTNQWDFCLTAFTQ